MLRKDTGQKAKPTGKRLPKAKPKIKAKSPLPPLPTTLDKIMNSDLVVKSPQLDETRRESSAGVHWAELYNACQWKYFLMYKMGIETKSVDKALIGGSAFHETKAVFYTTASLDKAMKRGYQEIDERKQEFYDVDDYEFTRGRIGPMFKNWVGTFGDQDFKRYEILAVEQEFRLPIPFTPGYNTTQRHDALLRDLKTGKVITGETKTASSSIDFTLNTVRMSAQVTAYTWGGYEVFGKDYAGLMIDVTYWSSRSKNPGTIKSQRSELIHRTSNEIKTMKIHMASLFNEIDAKDRALSTGTPAEFLYRKNTFYCFAYFRKCAYADICGLNSRKLLKNLPSHLRVVDFERRADAMSYDPYFAGEGPVG